MRIQAANIVGPTNSRLGTSVSINAAGTVVAMGLNAGSSNSSTNPVRVRVYSYSETDNNWNQIGEDIMGEKAKDDFGISVSLDREGSKIAIGSYHYNESFTEQGRVAIYHFQ